MSVTETSTPGPWKWMDYPDGRKLLLSKDRAVIHCPDAPMTCDPADARLIAAAPKLFAALKEVCIAAVTVEDGCAICGHDLDATMPHYDGCAVAIADAAIADVEGR